MNITFLGLKPEDKQNKQASKQNTRLNLLSFKSSEISFGGKKITQDEFINQSRLDTQAEYKRWKNPNSPRAKKDAVLSIFHMNNNHMKYKRLSKIATAVNTIGEKLNKEGVGFLRVHSGDYGNYKGFKDLLLQVLMLNQLGINVSTIGNHDLDLGSKTLAEVLKSANFTTVDANLNMPEGCGLDKLTQGDNPKIVRSKVLEINGQHYGVLGISPPDLYETLWKGSLDKLDGVGIVPDPKADLNARIDATIEEVKKEVDNLLKKQVNGKNINKVILVSHAGFDLDRRIASEVSGIDIILGGHSHELLTPFEPHNGKDTVVTSPAGEPVFIFQSGQNCKNFLITDVAFDKKGVLLDVVARVEKSDDFADHEEAKKLPRLILGDTKVAGVVANDCLMEGCKIEEHPFANFVADSLRKYADADVAIIPGFSIRDDVDAGEITDADISNALSLSASPDLKLIKRKMSGQQILEAIERGAYSFSRENPRPGRPGILQVSGMKYTLDYVMEFSSNDAKPVKCNVTNVQVLNKDGSYSPLKPDKVYNVVYEKKLQEGIEDFKSLMEPVKDDDVIYQGITLPEIVVNEIKNHNGPVELKTDGRITRNFPKAHKWKTIK